MYIFILTFMGICYLYWLLLVFAIYIHFYWYLLLSLYSHYIPLLLGIWIKDKTSIPRLKIKCRNFATTLFMIELIRLNSYIRHVSMKTDIYSLYIHFNALLRLSNNLAHWNYFKSLRQLFMLSVYQCGRWQCVNRKTIQENILHLQIIELSSVCILYM